MTQIDILVPTFRRGSLRRTILSVLAQDLPPGVSTRIIIADNDDTPSAEPLVRMLADTADADPVYVHAPARNISLARNAALDAAQGDFAALIDDDETAAPDWLAQMLRVAAEGDYDAVFGPSVAQYPDDSPDWIVARDYHSNIPLDRGGPVRTGHTSNALIRLSDGVFSTLRFDPALGLTGGEDTDYFFRAWREGARMGIAPAAMVFEPVAAERLTFAWLAARRYREGQAYGRHAWAGSPLRSAGTSALAVGKAGLCLSVAAAMAFSPERRNFWALRARFHAGVVSAGLGRRGRVAYGADEAPALCE